MVDRFDKGLLGKVERTPQGGIRVQASLTRTGLLSYQNPDGSARIEYRPPDEVFHAKSLASLRDAPITNLHRGMIDPSNYRKAVVGVLSGDARQDGDVVAAALVIQDAYTIGLIDSGERREVSCGYRCRLDHTPGKTPQGEPYDAIQRDIVYNHVALVPRGRAGRDVALRLDSSDNQIRPEGHGDPAMKIEIISGTEYEVGTPAHRAAAQTRGERLDAASKTEGENAALKAEIVKLKEHLDAAPADLAAAVKVRTDLLAQAAKARVEVREDMSDEDVRRAVISKVLPSVDIEGRDEAYVSGVFAAALGQVVSSSDRVREDALRSKRGPLDDSREDSALPPDVIARREMIKRTRKAASQRGGLDKS